MAFDHFHGQGRKGADGATGSTGAAGPNIITSATTTDFTAGLITSNGSGGITRTVVGGLGASLIAADFASEGQTALALVPGTNVQAYDGTLLAFAGLTIAANSLTIGTGADAFSQVSFAANTFPARASTGDLVAKSITDAALSVLDDTTVADMRTTLGGTTIGQAVFTQTNPSALTYPRYNADNTVSALTLSDITRSTPYWFQDFINTLGSDPFQVATAINSGTFGGGASSVNAINHPGIITFLASASANSGGYVFSDNNRNTFFWGGNLGMVFDAILYFPIVAGTVVRWGFLDTTTSSDSTDGVYFEISGSGAVVVKASSNSSRTTSSTIATLSATTWYRFQIVEIDASTFEGRVYSEAGSLLGSQQVASNVPTANTRASTAGLIATHTAGSAGQGIVFVDYLGYGFTKALTR